MSGRGRGGPGGGRGRGGGGGGFKGGKQVIIEPHRYVHLFCSLVTTFFYIILTQFYAVTMMPRNGTGNYKKAHFFMK